MTLTSPASADSLDLKVDLRARVFGDAGTNITYSASVSEDATITAETAGSDLMPGNVVIGGSPEPGQTVTITLQDDAHSYTTVAGDTLETVVSKLADIINNDPNVSASADLANLAVDLQLRNPDEGLSITLSASVSEGATLTVLTPREHLAPGVANVVFAVRVTLGDISLLVPGDVLIGGTPAPDQTVEVTLSGTVYSYTTIPGDTLETVVTKLAELIDDPNVSATADPANRRVILQAANSVGTTVTFSASVSEGDTLTARTRSQNRTTGVPALVPSARLVKGAVGLYQVNFTVPDTIDPNPETKLTLIQNLIVFGLRHLD